MLASQLGVDPAAFSDYRHGRDTTRREHVLELQRDFGFASFSAAIYRELAGWLLPIALTTDVGTVLVGALIDEMRERKVLAPALSSIERLAWETRRRAERLVFVRLTAALTDAQRAQLDALLVVQPGARMTTLAMLRQPPRRPTPATFMGLAERLQTIRAIGINAEVARKVHPTRLVRLAREGARYSPQFLQRFSPERRYATLVAFLLETSANFTDEAIELHDRLIGQYHNQTRHAHAEQFQQSGRAINEKVRLYASIGAALISAREAAVDPYQAIEAILPWTTFVDSVAEAEQLARPARFDPLALLATAYPRVRRYAPTLLDSFEFQGTSSCQSLLDGLKLLKELNASERLRRIPRDAPIEFISPRWEPHVLTKTGVIDRPFYELCALSTLRDRLRAGDVWVAGSRQYRAFDEYLLPQPDWLEMRETGPVPVAVETTCTTYLDGRRDKVDYEMNKVASLLENDQLSDVRLRNGRLLITPLRTTVPPEAEELGRRAYEMLRWVRITDLLVEVDEMTGMSRHFTHLQTGEPVKDPRALYTVLLAEATNLGLAKMAQACPEYTYRQLAWIADWYVRDETCRQALASIINAQHRHPFAAQWGDGTTSSSDAQQFPVGGRSAAIGRVNAHYGPEPGVKLYTHLSDQYGPYHSTTISATASEAPYLVDGLLYHETDLEIAEHYSDTGAFTDQIFGICQLLGFRYAPRIRDLADKRLHPFEKSSSYPALEPLIGDRINVGQIESQWDELLRLATSIRQGTVTASLVLRKLASYPRQNGLAWGLRELGRIDRTLFMLEWLQSPELRRRVSIGLNKGEAKNALSRAVCFHRRGMVHDRTFDDQRLRAGGLNLVVAAIVYWNTVYLEQAVATLSAAGLHIPDGLLQHLSPLAWEHIVLTGEYRWTADVARRPGQRRELRPNPDAAAPLASSQPTVLPYSFPKMMS
jgi:TnpA family transposase